MSLPCLRRHARGTVAVEVALVVPIYLLIIFGLVDVGRFFIWVDQARRCAIVAANAASQADPTTSNTSVSSSFLSTILTEVSGDAPAAGWNASNGLIITAITLNASGEPTQELQSRYPSTLTAVSPYTCGASFDPPVSFIDPNDTVLVSEVYYTFKPFVFLSMVTGLNNTITVHDYSFYRVRQPTTLTNPTAC